MCGIVGYIGKSDGQKFVLNGLEKLEYLIGLVTHPALDPARGLHVVQRAPVVTPGGKEGVQAVAQLGHQAQPLESEQRHGIASGLKPILEPVTHAGFCPAHPVGQAQLVQHLQEGMVRDAVFNCSLC